MLEVLIIDDDPDLRAMLREMLGALGCAVTEAQDGAAGLSCANAQDFDLVITDILMPRQEGIETIVRLRKAKPQLPIVAMSGGGQVNGMAVLEFADKLGADLTLEKPFSFQAIADVVAACKTGEMRRSVAG